MQAAITAFANGIPTTQVDPSLVISKAAVAVSGHGRLGAEPLRQCQIALYQFKTGTGTIAYDTSGVQPELDLKLSGNYTWVSAGASTRPGLARHKDRPRPARSSTT